MLFVLFLALAFLQAFVDTEEASTGLQPLHLAAHAGMHEVVVALAPRLTDLNAPTRGTGQTALHLACAAGQLETVRLLVDQVPPPPPHVF